MIELEPFTSAQARKSTLVVAGVMALLGAWQVYRARPVAARSFGAIVVVLLVCAAIPPAARAFHRAWMTLAGILGYVNSRILLSAMFYLVLTPFGVVMRLLGHDALERRKGKEASYWRKRAATRQAASGYERAF